MVEQPAPVGDAEFAELMGRLGPWSVSRRLAVAVSGGADSMCLAWLARRWGEAVGLIIDHGLRAGSDDEAAEAAARLATFGMTSRIMRLDLRQGTALAARAREARYAALAAMARAEGLLDLLVGHHARDQAETRLIRGEARSRASGLAAMAAVVETPALRIVRPMLGISPYRLRATLAAAGVGWSEDPTNASLTAARAQFRRRLDDAGDADHDTSDLAAAAARSGRVRQDAEALTAAVLAGRVSVHPEGYAVLSPGPIEPAALSALLRSITGASYPARTAEVERLARDPRPATVAGVQLLPAGRLGDGLLVVREAAAMPRSVEAGAGVQWDRRFTLESGYAVTPGAMLGAIGEDAAALREVSNLPSAVLRTMPALRCNGRVVGLPLAHHPAFVPGILFRPAVPLAGAGFFAGLFV